MIRKLQNTAENESCFFSKKIIKNSGLSFMTLLVFLLISVKGNAQINENFDSGIPSTWTLIDNGVGTTNWATTTDGYLGSNGTSVNPSADNIGDQNTAQYFLVTPQIAVPENGEIQFYTKQSNEADNGAQYEIRLSTASQPDVNGFNITLQSYTESNLNIGAQTNYEKKVVEIPTSIPAGLNIYIAFVVVNTQSGTTPTGDEWFVDGVSVLEGCTEIDDVDVTIDSITVNSAEVNWSHATATDFEIQILPTGGVPADSGIPVTGTAYTLNNLDEDTEFDVYLSAVCDNDTQSDFVGPYTFRTLKFGLSCESPIIVPDISSTPYVLVDNLDQWINPDISYTTQGSNCVLGASTTNYLNGNKIFLSYTPTVDGLVTLTQTTAVEPGGGDNNCWNSRSSLFVYDSCESVGVNCLGGTITINAYDPKSISNLLVEAGETYIIVVSTEFSTPTAGVCFSLEISAPNCAPPTDLVYNNLTEDSVSFSWGNIGGFADTWEYTVVPTGSGEPTGSGTPTTTNTDNLVNTGLVSDTTYDLYVRSICGGTAGIWSNPLTFTTQCTTLSLPYFTDFDTATNQNPEPCWTTIDANGDGVAWNFIGGYATMRTEDSRFENNDFYVSPRVAFDGTPKRIRYKHRSTQGGSTYTVKLSTTGVGIDDFSTIVLPATTITNTSFQEIIVDLPEGITGEVNIAWIVEPNTTESALRVSIDDVYIEDKPSCPDPLNPFVLQITSDSAWLFWTAGGDETQWEVVIQDLDAGEPTGPGVLTTSNFPYMATGLDSGNRYEFYVRAYCEEDDVSQWVGPLAFTTLCEAYDTPFYESFNDDDNDTQKFCWAINDANNDGATWDIDGTHAVLQTSAFAPPSDFNDYLISPAINIDGVKELKFKYRSDFSFFSSFPRFGLEVLMSTTNTNPGSFSVISPLEIFTNPNYEEKSIIIEATGTVYIAFRVPPEFNGSWSVLSIDDVSITDVSACPNPSDLAVNNVFTTTADLSWTVGYEETSWNIALQPAGSGEPTDSGIAVSSTDYAATDLEPNTAYEFYVQANCDEGNSEWIGPMTFSTSCNAFASPFVETFNSNSETKECWIVVNDNDDGETWELNVASLVYEGDQAAAMFTGTNGLNDDWLISPTITITENQRLRYYYRVYDGFFTEDLEVLLSTNGTGLDQFTTVLYDSDDDSVLINNEEFKVKIINLPSGITGDVNIAFYVPYFASTEPYRGQTLVIDNVNIEDIPNCPEPTNIILNNITDTEVQVSWDANGTETEWELSVQPSGSSAPVGDTDPDYLFNASTNPFTITGLTASTMYDIYIRAVCDGNDGEWTEVQTVTTKCSFENLCQYTFILTSDFNTSSTLDITQNNQVVQSLPFTGQENDVYTAFLCSGVEFSLFFDTIGWSIPQYANYQFEVQNSEGVTIYTSPQGLLPRTTIYTGTAICGAVSCPQPTDLTVSNLSELSWTAGGNETQWEVAIQPFENGTIPQSGIIVSANSYIPTDADFNDLNAATYEFFVRAVCGSDDESYWSGPFEFIRNDDVLNAITLPINDNEVCDVSGTTVSFINSSVSSEAMSCDGTNGGDIWFDFTAESLIHIIEINNFNGSLQEGVGDPYYPEIVMTLYKNNGAGNLEEVTCSYDNLIVAMYSSELIVGQNYKLRITLNSDVDTEYLFDVCIKTPEDLCAFETVNGGFEEPNLPGLSGITTIVSLNTLPGWRSNLDSTNEIFYWESLNAPGFECYEGGQCAQLLSDQGTTIDPNDPDIKGYYRDFDTSEITLYDYSFAHLARSDDNIVQLFAGPIGGPYIKIDEHLGIVQAWTIVSGEYSVPTEQSVTRFIFRAHDGDDLGNVLDAVNFVPNNALITAPFAVDCDNNSANVEANGTGTWVPSDSNPGAVSITDANSSSTTITNFVQPGVYIFTWQTSYCAYDLEITYNGIADTPQVEALVEYCLNDAATELSASTSGSYDLMWFTEAVGGIGSAIAPTPNTSVVNTTSYYAAFVDAAGCEGPRAEIQVVVSESFTPELTFTYNATCVVATENPTPSLSADFETGGVFSSTSLSVDAITGVIDMTSASVGQHDVTYTYDGDDETCTSAGTYVATIEFTEASTPVTSFNYGTVAYCELLITTITPSLDPNFTTGGTFSSSTLTVDSTTGAIDLTSVATGNHDVTYTVEANGTACSDAGSTTTTIEVTASTIPVTEFTYTEDVYCADSNSILPNMAAGFTTGGTFSSENGLSINALTGEINVGTSSVGNYNVIYEIAEDISSCVAGETTTFNITILDEIEVGVEGECNDSDYILIASPLDNSFDTSEADYTWMDANGNVVGQNSEVFNVSEYAADNPNETVPLQFSVIVDFGGCSVTTTHTTERLSCKDIPRGISPDGNGKNDTFDLSGYGVKMLNIYNRHGREVYNFNGTYINQWFGQSNNGDDLPDGTYFYSLHKDDGSSLTGWVFINRAQ
ncbi:gliding motility-associated-like protein [Winogradskyella pacifica]|uniref:Gliding motility-associated-like protein n=1 Tax=Winogradskyella pacifica TaxID=664642 RepID=A0A3D9N0I8_9FLAO|nr:choice-of-anchor J domain-containing protein [Winogradskyella pacifica]REE25087.1 gliding motility-associated-like protein [Winogradskyella pacifica]